MPDRMSFAIMAKNYSHCPLKKRPVQFYEDVEEVFVEDVEDVEDIPEQPENLSTKPEDLRLKERCNSVSPPSSSAESSPTSPSQLSEATSPPCSPPMSRSPPLFLYHPKAIKSEPQLPAYATSIKSESMPYPSAINPEYTPQTWHRSVAPIYPPSYQFMPYGYDYMGQTSPHSDSSLSPPHHMQQPLVPLALRPVYASIDQSSLSPSSSTNSPSPTTIAEDLSERRRQGIRHQCTDCGKSYSTFSGLSKHRQFHCAAGDGPKKTFNCKYCSKVYTSLGALKMHIRTHTLPCKCTICGKAFSRPWLLQGHVRTHTGEKPFSCTYCNRAFADRSNLRAHLQTHSDVKKYSCPSCSKTFSRMSLLTKHSDGGCSGAPSLLHTDKMTYVTVN